MIQRRKYRLYDSARDICGQGRVGEAPERRYDFRRCSLAKRERGPKPGRKQTQACIDSGRGSEQGSNRRPNKQQTNSATGTRTRVARVRAEYPNQLDYSGAQDQCKA